MIIISKDSLADIKSVCSIAKDKAQLEITQNVLIESTSDKLRLTTTNLEVEVTRCIDAKIESGFSATVNAKKFSQSVAACGKDIKIELLAEGAVQIKSGRKRFKLPSKPAEDFPVFPVMESTQKLDVDALDFANLAKAVMFASAVDDVRYVMNGVYIGKHVVATNGHRMSWLNIGGGFDCEAIIPRDSVAAMPEIGGEVYCSYNALSLEYENMTFKTKLVDGKYPSYERLFQDKNKNLTVEKSELIDAIKSAMITANDKSRAVVFNFNPQESTVQSKSGTGHDSEIGFICDCPEEFEIAINSDYLLAAVDACDSEQVEIYYEDSQRPIYIPGNQVNSIVMPVRL